MTEGLYFGIRQITLKVKACMIKKQYNFFESNRLLSSDNARARAAGMAAKPTPFQNSSTQEG